MLKKYALYLFRWQMSTPILAVVIALFPVKNEWISAIVANLIGGLIFFWVDRLIFRQQYIFDVWSVEEDVTCADCGTVCRGYRLVKSKTYDKTNDKNPKFRCESCSKKKYDSIKNK
ncbi:MAG: hypothetical protein N2Z65_07775 [Clostridiales bacterium]|nr:hypothetical protein [Clostridiales bacterium]